MKKIISLILVLALSLSLGACGESEAVKNVEAMFQALLESSECSGEQINAAWEAYAALSDKEKKKIRSYDELEELSDAYFESVVAGTWFPFQLQLVEPEYIFTPRFRVEINADKTYVDIAYNHGDNYGQWEINEGKLLLHGINGMTTETAGWVSMENDYVDFSIQYNDGRISLLANGISYYQEDSYFEVVEEVVIELDSSDENFSDSFGFTSCEVQVEDEWGVHTGHKQNRLTLQNLLYEDGWMYLGRSQDFMLEVLYPEYEETYYFTNGTVHTNSCQAGGITIAGPPYTFGSFSLSWSNEDATVETDLTLEAFSIGRAKGALYFINSKYVKEIHKSEYGDRILILDMNSENYFLGVDFVYNSIWEEANQAY